MELAVCAGYLESLNAVERIYSMVGVAEFHSYITAVHGDIVQRWVLVDEALYAVGFG